MLVTGARRAPPPGWQTPARTRSRTVAALTPGALSTRPRGLSGAGYCAVARRSSTEQRGGPRPGRNFRRTGRAERRTPPPRQRSYAAALYHSDHPAASSHRPLSRRASRSRQGKAARAWWNPVSTRFARRCAACQRSTSTTPRTPGLDSYTPEEQPSRKRRGRQGSAGQPGQPASGRALRTTSRATRDRQIPVLRP